MRHRLRHLRPALFVVIAWSTASAPAAAEDREFVAMDDGRFALVESAEHGVIVRFAQDQFGPDDRGVAIYGIGGAELRYDATSRTLLLFRGDEGSLTSIIGFTPAGDERYRLRPESGTGDQLSIVPGAGRFSLSSNSELTLYDCRTGDLVQRFTVARAGQQLTSTFPLDRGQFLAVCAQGDKADLVLIDGQHGLEIWRQPVEGLRWLGPGTVVWNDHMLSTAASRWPGPTALETRSRSDGSVLARVDLNGDYPGVVGLPRDSLLAVFEVPSGNCGGLVLRDMASLAVRDTIALPSGWPALGIRQAWPLANGDMLLDGQGLRSCPDAVERLGSGRWWLEIADDGAAYRARVLTTPVAVDPQGQGWRLRSRHQEVGSDVPWVTAGLPDPDMPALPESAFGNREVLPAIGGAARRTYGRSVHGGGATADTTAFTEFLDDSDVCFLGTLESIERLCVGRDGRAEEGVAQARFRMEEVFWGPPVSGPVFIDSINVPGCVENVPPGRLNDEDLKPGSRHIVVARLYDGVPVVRGAGLLSWRQGTLEPFELDDGQVFDHPLGRIRARAACGDLRDQFRRADLVVEATIVREIGGVTTVATTVVHKGAVVDRCLDVDPIREQGRTTSWRHRHREELGSANSDYLLFLEQVGTAHYRLLEGRLSVLRRVARNDFRRGSGLAAPELSRILEGR